MTTSLLGLIDLLVHVVGFAAGIMLTRCAQNTVSLWTGGALIFLNALLIASHFLH